MRRSAHAYKARLTSKSCSKFLTRSDMRIKISNSCSYLSVFTSELAHGQRIRDAAATYPRTDLQSNCVLGC